MVFNVLLIIKYVAVAAIITKYHMEHLPQYNHSFIANTCSLEFLKEKKRSLTRTKVNDLHKCQQIIALLNSS